MHMEIWRMDKGGGTHVWRKYWNSYIVCFSTVWLNGLRGTRLLEHWQIVLVHCQTQSLVVLFINKGCVWQYINTICQYGWHIGMPNSKLRVEQFTITALVKEFLSSVLKEPKSLSLCLQKPELDHNGSLFNPSCISPCPFKKHCNVILTKSPIRFLTIRFSNKNFNAFAYLVWYTSNYQ